MTALELCPDVIAVEGSVVGGSDGVREPETAGEGSSETDFRNAVFGITEARCMGDAKLEGTEAE